MMLTKEEMQAMYDRLRLLLEQGRVDSFGVDVWLAPGGEANLDLLMLDPDDEDVDALYSGFRKLEKALGKTPQQFG